MLTLVQNGEAKNVKKKKKKEKGLKREP